MRDSKHKIDLFRFSLRKAKKLVVQGPADHEAKQGDAARAFLRRHGPAARLLNGITTTRCKFSAGGQAGSLGNAPWVSHLNRGLISASPALRSNRVFASALWFYMEITREAGESASSRMLQEEAWLPCREHHHQQRLALALPCFWSKGSRWDVVGRGIPNDNPCNGIIFAATKA